MVIPDLRERLHGAVERMDAEGGDRREIEEALEGLAWINRRTGGIRLVLAELPPLLEGIAGPARIVDVATGHADIPRAIARWARRRGREVAIDCVDRSREILDIARRATPACPGIRFLAGDAAALPYPDGGADVVIISLALHHMEGDGAVRLLSEAWRVARSGVLVNDLRRGLWPYLVTWAFLHGLFRNRLILFDGPLSVRRAYTPEEMGALAARAGWTGFRAVRRLFFRVALVGAKGRRDGRIGAARGRR